MTKEEALEHLALAIYQRRRRCDLLRYGGAEGDMNLAKSVMAFFDDYHGVPHNSLDTMKLEDYRAYLPLYEFLKEQMGDA